MQAPSIDQRMVEVRERLPNLNPAEYSIIRSLFIKDRNAITIQKAEYTIKTQITHTE